jgi:hypothetical protein
VPRFYFHLFNDVTSLDEEGVELPNVQTAIQQAGANARHMAAQSVIEGHLTLNHRIEVMDEAHKNVCTVRFRDVVEVRNSD